MRRFFADTFAMITFSTVVGMAIEIASGMTLKQSAQVRLTAIPVNFLTARLYGMFRDWMFRLFKIQKNNQFLKGIADILAFVLFQVPLYATILATSGDSVRQIAISCSTITILSVFMGRPYGIFLDFSRWLFRIKK